MKTTLCQNFIQMSGSRMKMAGRFRSCVHMGCFDLHTFVELNQRTRKVVSDSAFFSMKEFKCWILLSKV